MAELFNLDLETGDLSQFDATTTDGGDLSAEAGAALGGSSVGLQAVLDDATGIYGQKNETHATEDFRLGWLWKRNTLTCVPNGQVTYMLFGNVTGGALRWRVGLRSDPASSSSFVLQVQVWKDDLSTETFIGTTVLSTSDEVLVEFSLARAASSVSDDGVATLYINGTQEVQDSTLQIFTLPKTLNVWWGAPTANVNYMGTMFQDRLIMRDDLFQAIPEGKSIKLLGTEASINSQLASLKYTPDTGYLGNDELTIEAEDAAGNKDIDVVPILVNDGTPINNHPSDMFVLAGQENALAGFSVSDIDDDVNCVTVTVVDGLLSV